MVGMGYYPMKLKTSHAAPQIISQTETKACTTTLSSVEAQVPKASTEQKRQSMPKFGYCYCTQSTKAKVSPKGLLHNVEI